MNIGIYFENETLKDIDYSTIQNGNPGISGTMLQFAILITYLSKAFKNDSTKVTQFCQVESKISSCPQILVNNEKDLIYRCLNESIDFLIMRDRDSSLFFNTIIQTDLKVIFWGHNYYFFEKAKLISNCSNIIHNVFVSNQMMLRYIDHEIVFKSSFIFNMSPFKKNNPTSKNIENVILDEISFIGAIVPSKGFHKLAKIWKSLLLEFPSLKLNVIGSGSLYDRSTQLGSFGVAEHEYEKKILKYLSDDKGVVLDSVLFHGNLNSTQIDTLLKRTAVGIINPSGNTETFGVSALDFARNGVPVISKKKNGLLDSIIDKQTGLLISYQFNFKTAIKKLLINTRYREKLAINSIKHSIKFDPKFIIPQWLELLKKLEQNNLPLNKNVRYEYLLQNMNFVRVITSILRFRLKLRFIPPFIKLESFMWNLKYFIKTKIKRFLF